VEIFKSSILLVGYRRRVPALRPLRALRVFRNFGTTLMGEKATRELLFSVFITGLLNDNGASLFLFSCERSSHGLGRKADISNYVKYYK
jgi:hypothetical protein